jgi:hypothetical protein
VILTTYLQPAGSWPDRKPWRKAFLAVGLNVLDSRVMGVPNRCLLRIDN